MRSLLLLFFVIAAANLVTSQWKNPIPREELIWVLHPVQSKIPEDQFIKVAKENLPNIINLTDNEIPLIRKDEQIRKDLVNQVYDLVMLLHKTEADQARGKLFVDNVMKFILKNDEKMVIQAIKYELSDILKNIQSFADQVYHL